MNYAVKNIYGKTTCKKVNVTVPGSKSVTARALLLAAIASGESTLYGVQYGDDCAAFLNCLKGLGVKTSVCGTTVKIWGCGGKLSVNGGKINVGSAGTAARFLPAFLAFQEGEFTLESSEQMKKRPLEPLIKTLEDMGAKFTFHELPYRYPFTVKGTASPKTSLKVDIGKSSQFLSALLISAVCAGAPVTVAVDGAHGLDYVNMTLEMIKAFGTEVCTDGGAYTVSGGYTARDYKIEPDISAACYFYAINKILGCEINVDGIPENSLQGDIKFIRLLKNFNGGKVDMGGFSDQTLTLAAIAPYLDQPTEIVNVAHIRGQECDRIAAITHNLTAMGVKCEERADGVKIYPSQPKPAKINTFGDHRVAMSFAVTGLRADGIVIENSEVCSKTFAGFFNVLNLLCDKLTG